jgi:hypothetical protein
LLGRYQFKEALTSFPWLDTPPLSGSGEFKGSQSTEPCRNAKSHKSATGFV